MKISLEPIYDSEVGAIAIDKPHFVVGRAADCDLVLDSPLISRRHCVITIDDEVVSIRDLESMNGTKVNGRRIFGRRLIFDGDVLHLDAFGFRIHIRTKRPLSTQLLQFLPGRSPQSSSCHS